MVLPGSFADVAGAYSRVDGGLPMRTGTCSPVYLREYVARFGRHGFYLKNADVIERLASVDGVVFDKTGTITHGAADVVFCNHE